MARNGSGTYSLPAGNPVVTGTAIQSTWANTTLSDIATALTQSISQDGQTPVTANLPMGGFKLTGLAAGTTAGDSVRYEQFASPPAIGGTAAAAGSFTTLSASSTVSGTGFSTYLASPPAIGGTAPAAGNFTTLGATGQITSTVATGTPPMVIASTTEVANLHAATATTATTASNVSGTIAIANGGTGATTAATAAANLAVIQKSATTNTTSGTSIDIAVTAGAKRITLNMVTVSTNGTSNFLVQLGTGGVPTTSGYQSYSSILSASASSFAYSTGFGINHNQAALFVTGSMVFELVDSSTNTWVEHGVQGSASAGANTYTNAGVVALAGTCNLLRLTTVNGTDAFDFGFINVTWEF